MLHSIEGRDVFGAQQQLALESDMQASRNPQQGHTRHLPMHQDSSQLSDCLNPVRGIRDLQIRCVIPEDSGL